MPEAARGSLDLPAAGDRVDATALQLAGWVMFEGAQVDYVDVFVNDAAAGRASLCWVRPDVAAEMALLHGLSGSGAVDVNALTSGFNMVVPLPPRLERQRYTFHARATSTDRRVWYSPARTVEVHPPVVKPRPSLTPQPVDGSFARLAPGSSPSPGGSGAQRVCVFAHSLSLGGGELYLQELLLRIRQGTGAEILVISPSDGPLREDLAANEIRVHVTNTYSVDPHRYGGRVTELVSLIRDWRPDVVIVNTLGAFPAADAALHAGVPAIWAIHESFELESYQCIAFGWPGLAPPVRERFMRALLSAELVYEATSTLQLHASQLPGIRARRIQYGVDVKAIKRYCASHDRNGLRRKLGLQPEDRILLCMGVIQERKAQIALFRSFVSAADRRGDVKLVLVGAHDGPYPTALRQCVEALDVGDIVRVVDVDEDVYQWYRAADVLVSASEVESLPRSILEAQAFGLPVVGADVFGVREVVEDGVNGWLFEARRASSMTMALARVVTIAEDELQQFSRQAKRTADAHDGSGYAQRYIELIGELAGRREAPTAAGAGHRLSEGAREP